MTCNECRWKAERRCCPWGFDYEGKDYAEDCTDFRNIGFPEDAFSEVCKEYECATCECVKIAREGNDRTDSDTTPDGRRSMGSIWPGQEAQHVALDSYILGYLNAQKPGGLHQTIERAQPC